MTDSSNSPKNRLNEVILEQGRHRKWLAQQVGISRTTLHRWCHDAYEVPEDQRRRLSEVLDVPEHELFPLEVTA